MVGPMSHSVILSEKHIPSLSCMSLNDAWIVDAALCRVICCVWKVPASLLIIRRAGQVEYRIILTPGREWMRGAKPALDVYLIDSKAGIH